MNIVLHFGITTERAAMCGQITEPPKATSEMSRPGTEVSSEQETILLVEDESFVREVTCEVLRSAGYQVLAARDGAEAECIYESRGGNVDLLLSDVILPGETGRALAGKLRGKNPALKVLLVSGYGEQIAMLESAGEGYLAKPFSSEGLLRRVRQIMNCERCVTGAQVALRHACGSA
jgi:CheY-like chemotaxis protein